MDITPTIHREMQRALDAAIPLASEVSALLMAYYDHPERKMEDVEIKEEDQTQVLRVEKEVTQLIHQRLREEGFHEYGFLCEEIHDDGSVFARDFSWVIDPNDSTKDLWNRRDGFGPLFALMYQGVPLVGVTCRPAKDQLVYASRGGGTWLYLGPRNSQRLLVSHDSLVRLVTTRTRISEELEGIIQRLNPSVDIKMGGVQKLIEIVRGHANVCIYPPANILKYWDTAANIVCLEEAEGKVTDVYGEPLHFRDPGYTHENGLIASNGVLHPRALDAVGYLHR